MIAKQKKFVSKQEAEKRALQKRVLQGRDEQRRVRSSHQERILQVGCCLNALHVRICACLFVYVRGNASTPFCH
jgi:hypothetical protein